MIRRIPVCASNLRKIAMLGSSGLFFLVATLGQPALATSVRTTALGGTGDYIEDDGNVLRWFGSLADYPDRLIIESGRFDLVDGHLSYCGQNPSGPGVGFQAAFDQSGRWGTGALFFHGQSMDSDPGSMTGGNLEGSITLLYARSLGFGDGSLYFRHAGEQESFTDSQGSGTFSRNLEQSRTDLGGGLRLDLTEGAYLDVAGEIRRHSQHRSLTMPGGLYYTGDMVSWNNWGLRSRAFVRLNERLALVPLAEYLREDHAEASDWWLPPFHQDGHLLRLGAGLNYFADTDHMLLVAVDYQNAELDNSAHSFWESDLLRWGEDRQVLAFIMGFEARLKTWLSFRASAGYRQDNMEFYEVPNDGADPANLVTSDGEFDHIPMSLGLACHLQDIDLELALTDRQPLPLAHFLYDPETLDQSTWLSLSMRYLF